MIPCVHRDILSFLSREAARWVPSALLMLLLQILCFEMLAAATVGQDGLVPRSILSNRWFGHFLLKCQWASHLFRLGMAQERELAVSPDPELPDTASSAGCGYGQHLIQRQQRLPLVSRQHDHGSGR